MLVPDLSNGLDPFSPWGIALLTFGVIFTFCIPFFLIKSDDFNPDKGGKAYQDEMRAKKIASLYPKKP
ncbi:Conserved hypothetical protein [Prochlorococcus marinus str. MIT 9313]|uniref:Uncharacterized protein n=1 Tax=Prochlorococcus marinus (strain MIT 9313) TaxID=74547 RepID=B9ER71_PROMM|nr:hypothetical protein [Prochlorococcus marinus]CAX32119.1 Conserved hypothetical protein [Prochlorococcus marinus str. MIT 9313]